MTTRKRVSENRKSQNLKSQTQSCISAVLSNPKCHGESGVKPVQCEHMVLRKTEGWRRWEGDQILTVVNVSGLVGAKHFWFLPTSTAKLETAHLLLSQNSEPRTNWFFYLFFFQRDNSCLEIFDKVWPCWFSKSTIMKVFWQDEQTN